MDWSSYYDDIFKCLLSFEGETRTKKKKHFIHFSSGLKEQPKRKFGKRVTTHFKRKKDEEVYFTQKFFCTDVRTYVGSGKVFWVLLFSSLREKKLITF